MVLWSRRQWRRNGWRRRFRKRDGDQLLNDVGRLRDIDVESAEQQGSERDLNENDRGKRKCALPRPNRSSWLCVSGHQPPASALQRV